MKKWVKKSRQDDDNPRPKHEHDASIYITDFEKPSSASLVSR